ncbi:MULTISPECIES: MFS transporter [unclassified Pseudoclavibacter]|uniref:MFS transporter n=1 Tax=unclassified Pseudoclavibacter TaxID=2615177 RepID=UPI001BAE4458|nr:MFS transporter [Pseudoclavibacter sp. Marseille-Q4354]MBS3179908.1 MFS transporter [Pseudoclavibacter sp. Marseille-Q4354]
MNLLPVTYLASHVLSLLGNSIAGIALPLIVLSTTGSALGAGTVAAATAIPAVLAGLFMGVVIDRINRRTSSVVTDLISAASIAALPIIDLISGLNLGWFVLFGIIGSLGDVPGMTAREALLPAIVRHGDISAERLMGVRESLSAVAIFIGPAAAGTLMVLFDGSTVLWITAATSLLAALITLLIPKAVGEIVADDGSRASTPIGSGWSQLRDGWRALFRSPFLVATTALSLVSVFVLAGLQGLVLPVYFTLVEQPGLLGFVLSALALGMLVGGGTYAVVGTRGPRRAWFVVGMIGTTIGIGLISLLTSVWVVFAGAFVMGAASGLFGSLMGVLMIERIPEQLRGRIMGTQNALTTAAPSLGIMLAAVLTEYTSVNIAALALLGAWGCAFLYGLAARPLRTLEPQATSANAGGVR